ncbi:ALP1-like protein [Tanacetum coccineum]|uniref:ALP1-like protein n=1 Tax=Tanacetum coccineum TaxID=301880 RepID=A0ABQ5HU23_9ASTR
MSSDLFFYNSSDDEDEVNSELAIFTEACQAAYKAPKSKIQRTQIERDRYGTHNRLVAVYFSEHPQYDKARFSTRFRMSRKLITQIVREVIDNSPFFQQTTDCTGRVGISSLMKCTSAIRQMTYGAVPDALDEYRQTGATTARMNNDVNVLRQSSLFNDLKSGKAPDVPFVANNVNYKRGHYLTDGIYPQWSVLIKSIENPGANDHK